MLSWLKLNLQKGRPESKQDNPENFRCLCCFCTCNCVSLVKWVYWWCCGKRVWAGSIPFRIGRVPYRHSSFPVSALPYLSLIHPRKQVSPTSPYFTCLCTFNHIQCLGHCHITFINVISCCFCLAIKHHIYIFYSWNKVFDRRLYAFCPWQM